MTILLLLVLPSHAGKLSEGYQGVQWGADYQTPPKPGCMVDKAMGIWVWLCDGTIGNVSVHTSWMSHPEVGVYGALSKAVGYDQCSDLFAIVKGVYGDGYQQKKYDSSVLPAWAWADGPAEAGFNYVEYSAECSLVVFHPEMSDRAKALIDAAAAARGAADL